MALVGRGWFLKPLWEDFERELALHASCTPPGLMPIHRVVVAVGAVGDLVAVGSVLPHLLRFAHHGLSVALKSQHERLLSCSIRCDEVAPDGPDFRGPFVGRGVARDGGPRQEFPWSIWQSHNRHLKGW